MQKNAKFSSSPDPQISLPPLQISGYAPVCLWCRTLKLLPIMSEHSFLFLGKWVDLKSCFHFLCLLDLTRTFLSKKVVLKHSIQKFYFMKLMSLLSYFAKSIKCFCSAHFRNLVLVTGKSLLTLL